MNVRRATGRRSRGDTGVPECWRCSEATWCRSLSILATIGVRLPGLPSRAPARRGLGEAAGSWCAESLAVDEHVGLPNGPSSPLLAGAASAVLRSAHAYTPVLDGRLLDDNLPTRRDSTIDVLLSTEVGMLQAPIGTTRVRASGVLSHPLASERGGATSSRSSSVSSVSSGSSGSALNEKRMHVASVQSVFHSCVLGSGASPGERPPSGAHPPCMLFASRSSSSHDRRVALELTACCLHAHTSSARAPRPRAHLTHAAANSELIVS